MWVEIAITFVLVVLVCSYLSSNKRRTTANSTSTYCTYSAFRGTPISPEVGRTSVRKSEPNVGATAADLCWAACANRKNRISGQVGFQRHPLNDTYQRNTYTRVPARFSPPGGKSHPRVWTLSARISAGCRAEPTRKLQQSFP